MIHGFKNTSKIAHQSTVRILTRYLHFRRCGISCSIVASLFLSVCKASDQSDLHPSPWHLASRGLMEEAHEEFNRLAKRGGNDREYRFGMAVTLLNVQPKTRRNVERAYHILEQLKDEVSTDHYGISAQYFLGRIDQIHRSHPNPESAARHYLSLIERQSNHPFAQLAVIKLGILELYNPSAEDVSAVFSQTEERLNLLTDSIAIRDFHILLAEAYERHNLSKSRSLEHLLAAQEIDPAIRLLDNGFIIRVADLARELGDYELSSRYYREFLDLFQRDVRRFQVARTLEKLSSVTKSDGSPNTE